MIETQPSMGKRQRRRIERTREILDTAMDIVVKEGPDALTMPYLAKRLGAAVGGLYRYFDGKAELLTALELEAVDAYRSFIEETLAERPRSPLEAVVAIFESWNGFAEAYSERAGLVDAMISTPRLLLSDSQDAVVQDRVRPALVLAAKALTRAVEAGILEEGDVQLRCQVMWGVMHGIGHFRKRDHREEAHLRSDWVRHEALTAMLVGWGATRSQVAAILAR